MAGVQRYEILGRIAKGGMAEVFLAHAHGEHGFRKDVAIKRILPHLAESAEFEAKFIAEAKLAVGLGHSNIVQVLDFGRDEHSLFIAMEYVRGANLAEVLRAAAGAATQLPLAAVMHVMLGIAHGIEFAHARRVLHRDLSPSNVLVSVAGEVKVADFGIAKVADAETGHRGIAGKWAYMSPEQARGERLDRRSDVFAAGVIMHELLTCRRLFARDHWEKTRAAVLAHPVTPPSQLRADVPAELDAIVLKALERDPERRFASCAELGRALGEACIAMRIVHAPHDVAGVIATLGLGRLDDAEPTAATAATAAELGGGAPRTLVRQDAPGELTRWAHAAPPAEARTLGRRRGALAASGLLVLGGAAAAIAYALSARDLPPAAQVATPTSPTAQSAAPTSPAEQVAAPSSRDAQAATPTSPAAQVTTPSSAAPVAVAAPPVPAPVAAARPPSKPSREKTQYGTITVQAAPWAHVYLGTKRLGTTPLLDVKLPTGRHKLTLVNPELQLRRTVTVDVPRAKPYAFRIDE